MLRDGMIEPGCDSIKHRYNARAAEKLRDFAHPLSRIEAAIVTMAERRKLAANGLHRSAGA